MQYELIREIFNLCSRNQMRDVFVSAVETDDTDACARGFCTGTQVALEKTVRPDGVIVYEIDNDGLQQRLSFTPED